MSVCLPALCALFPASSLSLLSAAVQRCTPTYFSPFARLCISLLVSASTHPQITVHVLSVASPWRVSSTHRRGPKNQAQLKKQLSQTCAKAPPDGGALRQQHAAPRRRLAGAASPATRTRPRMCLPWRAAGGARWTQQRQSQPRAAPAAETRRRAPGSGTCPCCEAPSPDAAPVTTSGCQEATKSNCKPRRTGGCERKRKRGRARHMKVGP